MRKLLLPIVLFGALSVHAGGENYHLGARATAMGGAAVTNTDLWSTHHNQAGLGWLRFGGAGAYYESRFLMKELGIAGFAFALPTQQGTFGLHASQFGYAAYNETKVSLNYGMALGEKVAIGVGLNYHGLRISAEDYGNRSAFTAEIGMMAKLTDQITIGAHLFNPSRTKIADYQDERIPTNLRFGLGYTLSKKVVINLETEKDIDHPISFKAGVDYHVVQMFYLRVGVSTQPTLTSFGFGLEFEQFNLDFSTNVHPALGITPQFSMQYNFVKSKNSGGIVDNTL